MFSGKIETYKTFENPNVIVLGLKSRLEDVWNQTYELNKEIQKEAPDYDSSIKLLKPGNKDEKTGATLDYYIAKLSDDFYTNYYYNRLSLLLSARPLIADIIPILSSDILNLDYSIDDTHTTATLSLKYNPKHLDICPGSAIILDFFDKRILTGFVSSVNVRKSISDRGVEYVTELNISSWENIYLRTLITYLWQLGVNNIAGSIFWNLIGLTRSEGTQEGDAYVTLGRLAVAFYLFLPSFLWQFVYSLFNLKEVELCWDKYIQEDEYIIKTMLLTITQTINSLQDVFNSFASSPNIEMFWFPDLRMYLGKKTWFYEDRTSNFFKKIRIPADALISEISFKRDMSYNKGSQLVVLNNSIFNNTEQILMALKEIPVSYRSMYNAVRAGFMFEVLNTQTVKPDNLKSISSMHNDRNTNTATQLLEKKQDLADLLLERTKHLMSNNCRLLDTYVVDLNIKTEYYLMHNIKQGDWLQFPFEGRSFIGRVNSINVRYSISDSGVESFVRITLVNVVNSTTSFEKIADEFIINRAKLELPPPNIPKDKKGSK